MVILVADMFVHEFTKGVNSVVFVSGFAIGNVLSRLVSRCLLCTCPFIFGFNNGFKLPCSISSKYSLERIELELPPGNDAFIVCASVSSTCIKDDLVLQYKINRNTSAPSVQLGKTRHC